MTGFHLGTDKRATLDEAAALVPSGATVALGGGLCARLPMALVRALVRAGRDELHVVGSAHSIDVDLLIAAGAVGVCEESYVGFEQDLGLAPAYRRAAETGAVAVRESCCVTVLTQLRAAEMGLSFLPVRGIKGTDMEALHPEYRRVRCPSPATSWWSCPRWPPMWRCCTHRSATRPATCTWTSPTCSTSGSRTRPGWSSRPSTAWCRASEVVAAGVTIPGHTVAAVVEAPFGAHPSSCYPGYAYDRPHLAEYIAAAAAGGEPARGLPGPVRARGRGRLPSARSTSPASRRGRRRDAAWQELFR